MAIKLLEGDQEIEAEWAGTLASTVSAGQRERLAARFQESAETIIAQERYTLIANVCHAAIIPAASGGRTISDRLDTVLTHRIWGLPIFLATMFLIFLATFKLGSYPSDWLQSGGMERLTALLAGLWSPGL